MTNDDAAACLEALGNPVRLAIYRLLVRAGPAGLPVGQVQVRMGMAGSTLSHHLKALVRVGVVRQTRDGTTLLCTADFKVMNALVAFLASECCADAGAAP